METWPALTTELCPLASLAPDPANAGTHSPEQIDQIKRSMLEFGFTIPVLVDEAGSIIAGHGRVAAAHALVADGYARFAEVPVMRASGWTDAQKRAYIIADNRLAENAGWDRKILQAELLKLSANGFDMSVLGFSPAELRATMRGVGSGVRNPDYVPPLQPALVSRPGDIWQLRDHRIMCGSSTDERAVRQLLGTDTPHLMVTDPPYGVKYDATWRAKVSGQSIRAHGAVLNDDRADWREAWALFPGEVAYVWHGALHAGTVQASLEACGFEARAQIIWVKDRLVLSRGHYHWQHEPCWYAVRSGQKSHWHGGRKRTTVMEVSGPASPAFLAELKDHIGETGLESTVWKIPLTVDDGSTGHSTQKPVECMQRPMLCNSEKGDAVYEPFSGSGSTLIAGDLCDRRVLAMELNPAYVDVAVRRWQNLTGETAYRISDGAAFDSVAPASKEESGEEDGGAWA